MGLNNFVNNGIQTSKKIYEAGIEKINNDKISFITFFGRALKQSSIGAYYVFIKSEIDNLIKSDEINKIKNDTSDKIAYLIGGYYLSPATLLNLKKELENNNVQVKIINDRYYSKDTLNKNIQNLKKQLQQETGKNIREGFSAIVPQVGDLPKNTIQLDNIYSHMTIGKKEVIDEIVNQILQSYNTKRI